MEKTKYIIIGGGMTGDSAIKGIREIDKNGRIIMFSMEKTPPYKRPLLSKGLWKNKELEDIWCEMDFENLELKLGTAIVEIIPGKKEVRDISGNEYKYEKLLIASGGMPRKILDIDEIIYFRTLDDYFKVEQFLGKDLDFTVLGSGFIGSELAAGLRMKNESVSLVDMGRGVAWRIFPENIVKYLNDYYKSKGVEILPDFKVTSIDRGKGQYEIESDKGAKISADVLVAGFGIDPNIELAKSAGLDVADGIVVDGFLRTSAENIYSAGDVANYYNPLLDKRIRVEHEDNANTMGKAAGRNMAGASEKFDYLPMFYSDMFDVGYEAVGILDSRFEVIQDWRTQFEKGVLYYLDDGRVRGVLLWNVWGKVDEAREVLRLDSHVNRDQLISRIT